MDGLKLNMYFNTSLRNMGLLTSISLALLAGSRFFQKEGGDDKRRVNLVRFATIFLIISIAFTVGFLIEYYNLIEESFKNDIIKDRSTYRLWILIPIAILLTNIIMVWNVYAKNL